MKNIKIYHNPRCSKSRQALALLQDKGIDPEIVEYLKTPPTPTELKQVLQQLNMRPRDLLRKTESIYKELGLSDSQLTDDDLIKAMCEHPKLIERPIVIKDNHAKVGRPPESVLDML